jgi:hypothetical protein
VEVLKLRLAEAEDIRLLGFHREPPAGKHDRINRPQDIGTGITRALRAASSRPH